MSFTAGNKLILGVKCSGVEIVHGLLSAVAPVSKLTFAGHMEYPKTRDRYLCIRNPFDHIHALYLQKQAESCERIDLYEFITRDTPLLPDHKPSIAIRYEDIVVKIPNLLEIRDTHAYRDAYGPREVELVNRMYHSYLKKTRYKF